MRVLLLISWCLVVLGSTAAADDGDPRFRRTTPRGSLVEDAELVIGIPGGRAWGIESELLPLPGSPTAIVARLRVSDPSVREAFLRVAYYASATARTRQLKTVDSAPVSIGERGVVAVTLDPPAGAVAYRVRVLARLAERSATSASDAIRATLHLGARPLGRLYSLLLP